MGVHGFKSYISVYYQGVSIDLNDYKDKILLIDGNAFLYYICKHFLNQEKEIHHTYQELENIIDHWLDKYLNIYQFRLIICFDGAISSQKLETKLKRILNKTKSIPFLALSTLKQCLKHYKHKNLMIYQCEEEADIILCQLAYYYQEHALAIVSEDSDFLLSYITNQKFSISYIPLSSINEYNSIVKLYQSKDVAQKLDLMLIQLPYLATLIGNDYISSINLKEFHQYLMNDIKQHKTNLRNPVNVGNLKK